MVSKIVRSLLALPSGKVVISGLWSHRFYGLSWSCPLRKSLSLSSGLRDCDLCWSCPLRKSLSLSRGLRECTVSSVPPTEKVVISG